MFRGTNPSQKQNKNKTEQKSLLQLLMESSSFSVGLFSTSCHRDTRLSSHLLPPSSFIFPNPTHHLLSFIHACCFPSLPALSLFVASFEVAGSPADFHRGQKRAALLSERACRGLHSRGHLSLVALRQRRRRRDCTRTSSSQPSNPHPVACTASPSRSRAGT